MDLLREKPSAQSRFGDTHKGFESSGYGGARRPGTGSSAVWNRPVCSRVMVLAFIGQTARLWYASEAAMKAREHSRRGSEAPLKGEGLSVVTVGD